jgi:hypothetical protein
MKTEKEFSYVVYIDFVLFFHKHSKKYLCVLTTHL